MFVIDDMLLAYFVSKGLDKLIENKEDYEKRLSIVINDTIESYKDLYFEKEISGKIAFYNSNAFINELLKYRIMKNDYNFDDISNTLKSNTNITRPKKDQLKNFYKIFHKKVNADEKLKKLDILESFPEEIFRISQKLDELPILLNQVIQEMNPGLTYEWKRQLNTYRDNIEKFKPFTALELLNKLEDNFNDVTQRPNDIIWSKLYLLKALCYELMSETNECFENYIRAYNLDKNNVMLKSKAAISHYKLKDHSKAIQLSNEVLTIEQYDANSWYVITVTSDEINNEDVLKEIPQTVKENIDFKMLLYFHFFISEHASNKYKMLELLRKHSLLMDLNLELIIENFQYGNWKRYFFLFEFSVNEMINENHLNSTIINWDGKVLIEFVNQVSEKIMNGLLYSEIYENNIIVVFFYHYTSFLLKGKHESVYEMHRVFTKLNLSIPIYHIIMANCFQQINENQNAINILEDSGFKDSEFLSLRTFCYSKLEDQAKFNEAFYDFVDSIEVVNETYFLNIMNYIFHLSISNLQCNIDKQKIWANKIYSHDVFNEFLKVFIDSVLHEDRENLIKRLCSLESKITELPGELKFFLAYSFFENKEYEKCIKYIRTFLDKTKESNYLSLYIDALYQSKQHSKELLGLLKKCRNEFSPNEKLLGIETELLQELSDWDEILKITKIKLKTDPEDEYFFVLNIITLNRLERKEEISELIESIKNFNFKFPQSYLHIYNVLYENKVFDLALEFLYELAKDANNKEARTTYFITQIAFPKYLFEELPTVTDSCFVKYQINDKTDVIEINKKNLSSNKLAKKMYRKEVNETFMIKEDMIEVLDEVKILKIMNKYSALLLEIIEEAQTPYSGLQLQTIHIDPNDSKSIEKSLINPLISTSNIDKKRKKSNISKYYTYQMSFSEIAYSNYILDFLDCYYHLTTQENGFLICPKIFFPEKIKLEGSEFILDFTSIILIYELTKINRIEISKKFIISKSVINIIEGINRKEKHILHSSQNTCNFQLNDLMAWINVHCEIRIVEDGLDLIRQNKEQSKIDKNLVSYISDNNTLANEAGNILVTDDMSNYKYLAVQTGKIISTEYYLTHMFKNSNEILVDLLKKKYLGITINRDILFQEYTKKIQSQDNVYIQCLNNLSLGINPNKYIIEQVIVFLKEIYASNLLSKKILYHDTVNLFVFLIRGTNKKELLDYIAPCIDKEFSLLGMYKKLKCYKH
ncbi:tetratricopeptide repeat protein [Bacteroidota bacterium]